MKAADQMAIDASYLFDNSFFTDAMKMARRGGDLTLDELSALTKEIDPLGVGISRVALSRYETGASLPGLRELRLLSFALRKPLSFLVYQDGTDPMSTYKLELELRIMETVNGILATDGFFKDANENAPKSDAYLALVGKVKDEKKKK
jgi:transcriptional regulator with XRE-family HTH domain